MIIKFLKINVFILLVFLLPLLNSNFVFANSHISSEAMIQYALIKGRHDLEVEIDYNFASSSNYPTVLNFLSLEVPFTNLYKVNIRDKNQEYNYRLVEGNDITELIITLDEKILKQGTDFDFKVNFIIKDFLENNPGNTSFEIDLFATEYTKKLTFPTKLSSDVKVRNIQIRYPSDYSTPLYSSARYTKFQKVGSYNYLSFSGNSHDTGYLSLILGDKIAYDFEINKSIDNSDASAALFYEISIPKEHHDQKVIFKDIQPYPEVVRLDDSNNLFFIYNIEASERIDINIKGQVLFNNSESKETLSLDQKKVLTDNMEYWELQDDTEFARFELFAKKNGFNVKQNQLHTEDFYKIVYDYVIDRLSIEDLESRDLNKENFSMRKTRVGAEKALERKDENIPEDYTDFMIALLRHYDIPSRMSIGYVMLNDYDSKGFFHQWVEVWDSERGWIELDPALDDLLKNKNLYNTGFLDHVTILVREKDSNYPKLGVWDQSNYNFDLASVNSDVNQNFKSSISTENSTLFHRNINGTLKVENTGNISLHRFTIKKNKGLNLEQDYNFEKIVLPGQIVNMPFSYKQNFYNITDNDDVDNQADVEVQAQNIVSRSQINDIVSTERKQLVFWWWDIFLKTVSVMFFLFFIFLIVSFKKVYNFIKNKFVNINFKHKKDMKVKKSKIEQRIGISIIVFLGLFMMLFNSRAFVSENVYGEGTDNEVEDSTTIKREDLVEVDLEPQSVWNNKIPVVIRLKAPVSANDVQVVWDVPDGLIVEPLYNNYFSLEKGQVTTVKANLIPESPGKYTIAVNVIYWAETNYSSSDKMSLEIDQDLLVTPQSSGYKFNVMIKKGLIGLGIVVILAVLAILFKILLASLKEWLKPPK